LSYHDTDMFLFRYINSNKHIYKYRIWAVHTYESFAFSTKDRAPILLCLEVIDYANKPLTDIEKIARYVYLYIYIPIHIHT
jgi:hypothetical protein